MSFLQALFMILCGINFINAGNYKLTGQLAMPAGIQEEISPSLARIFMDGGKQIAIPRSDGKFQFYNLEVGEHAIEIHLNGYEWHTYLIDVRNDGKIRTYIQGKKEALPPQLIIMPTKMAKYIPDPKPWNPLNFLKSGPGIMIAIMLVTTVILPKMMEGMQDPQAMLAEAQAAEQAQSQQSVQGSSSGSNNSRKQKNKTKG